MANAEATLWIKVMGSKFFTSTSEEGKEAEEVLQTLHGAFKGHKVTWLQKYEQYHGGYVWGVGER